MLAHSSHVVFVLIARRSIVIYGIYNFSAQKFFSIEPFLPIQEINGNRTELYLANKIDKIII